MPKVRPLRVVGARSPAQQGHPERPPPDARPTPTAPGLDSNNLVTEVEGFAPRQRIARLGLRTPATTTRFAPRIRRRAPTTQLRPSPGAHPPAPHPRGGLILPTCRFPRPSAPALTRRTKHVGFFVFAAASRRNHPMSTIIVPTPAQWAVLDALGILESGSFLIVNPADAAELREKRGLDLQHGQHTKVSTGLGEDDVFISFIGTDSWIVDELIGDEPNGENR